MTSGATASSVDRDVYVVVVVRGGGATVRHGAPALRGPLRGPDVLRPDHVVEAEGGGVCTGPVGDRLTERRVAVDHEVDRLARAVLAMGVVAAVRRQRREGVAHGAIEPDRTRGQAALGAGAV